VLADNYLFRRVSCAHCPIGCIHIGMLKTSFSRQHEYEIRKISYDFELIYALGSNLGVSSPQGVLELIEACEGHGIDAISTGVVLAWATEALDRGLITTEDTMGLSLKWDDVESYLEAIDNIVKMQNEFYAALAQGVEVASERYGGRDFAMALGKNEVPGYHTGPASIVGLTVGVRHSHLDNAGYSIDQKAAKKNLGPEEMVDAIIKEDDSRGVYNSLVGCLFARAVYTNENIVEALGSVGIEKTADELELLGRRIFDEKYRFKRREGFDLKTSRIPGRFFETISTMGMVDPETIDTMMEIYRKRRGW
ncbi:MAG TPA: aldehyde ferredoxin oxidoreductase C-terminal domain-containing protein, partial [Methanothrix sp.]|nr:aldehyde ferredoxin oxidoreductase C-terminal domain-containing protein [Methanothrix sp.]